MDNINNVINIFRPVISFVLRVCDKIVQSLFGSSASWVALACILAVYSLMMSFIFSGLSGVRSEAVKTSKKSKSGGNK